MLAYILMIIIGVGGNYIINGGFENPKIDPSGFLNRQMIEGWYGNFDMIGPDYAAVIPFTSQFINMDIGVSGWVAQDINIPT